MEHLDTVRDKIHDFTVNTKNTGCRHRGMNVGYLKLWHKGVIEKQITYCFEPWIGGLKVPAKKMPQLLPTS